MRPDEPGVRWQARLAFVASAAGKRCTLQAEHEGPLRLLKTLYPEGERIAHAVLVHPPGGLVGGDRLHIDITVTRGAHLLVTTPAATRFYRCAPDLWSEQQVRLRVDGDARLEWLPQETLAYPGCHARNRVQLQGNGQCMGSELLGLGLPAADQPFSEGELLQQLAIDGLWLDRGWLRAQDRALLDEPCGLAGRRVLGTLWLTQGTTFDAQALLDASRAIPLPAGLLTGFTALHGRLLLMRVLAHEMEPAQVALRRVQALWRERHWGLAPCAPRVWAT